MYSVIKGQDTSDFVEIEIQSQYDSQKNSKNFQERFIKVATPLWKGPNIYMYNFLCAIYYYTLSSAKGRNGK